WQLQENVPGEFPYTAGVFPLKREGEDPTRMFAGEGLALAQCMGLDVLFLLRRAGSLVELGLGRFGASAALPDSFSSDISGRGVHRSTPMVQVR
ncbi:MAG: hypothetical protein ABI410_08545, partial [Rhodoferax sp.]|uniref:hypothetical protein n=1 Tax=Rhodoferax sp. TaxID=50421 RepID=UPI003264432F